MKYREPEIENNINPRVLIVAYGNPLRSDDGVGWLVAEELRRRLASPEVAVAQLQQLLPELAEAVSRAEAVIFVDASAQGEPGQVRWDRVVAPIAGVRFAHQLSPADVVGLTRELYGVSPAVFSVTLAGLCFDHGEKLSGAVSAALPQLAARVEGLAKEILSGALDPAGAIPEQLVEPQ